MGGTSYELGIILRHRNRPLAYVQCRYGKAARTAVSGICSPRLAREKVGKMMGSQCLAL